jgi:hypothetical protein
VTRLFAAMHESAYGPKRHFVATLQSGRFRCEADTAGPRLTVRIYDFTA